MRLSLHIVLGAILATTFGCMDLAVAADFHARVIHPSATSRSSASRIAAKANANAGEPYVNPNVKAGHRTSQDNASANEDAAIIRNAHQNVTNP